MYKYFVLLRPTYPFPGTMTFNIYTTTPETAQLPSLHVVSILPGRGEGRARCAFYVKHNNNRLIHDGL